MHATADKTWRSHRRRANTRSSWDKLQLVANRVTNAKEWAISRETQEARSYSDVRAPLPFTSRKTLRPPVNLFVSSLRNAHQRLAHNQRHRLSRSFDVFGCVAAMEKHKREEKNYWKSFNATQLHRWLTWILKTIKISCLSVARAIRRRAGIFSTHKTLRPGRGP